MGMNDTSITGPPASSETVAPAPTPNISAQSTSPSDLELGLRDFKTTLELYCAGKMEAYRGKCVAVIDGRVVGVGTDYIELRERVSRQLGVSYERPAVTSIPGDDAII